MLTVRVQDFEIQGWGGSRFAGSAHIDQLTISEIVIGSFISCTYVIRGRRKAETCSGRCRSLL